MLLGRDAERARLAGLLAGARSGASAALVIRGEPGIGKSALLEYLVRRATGCRTARAAGIAAEMELPFAGLHQLCAPLLDGLDAVPEHQRAALRVALGLESGGAVWEGRPALEWLLSDTDWDDIDLGT